MRRNLALLLILLATSMLACQAPERESLEVNQSLLTFAPQGPLTPSVDPANPTPEFGASMYLSGSRLVVGAPQGLGAGEGSARVFDHDEVTNTWSETAVLSASDAAADDGFTAAAIDGDLIIARAPGADEAAVDGGAVYVFEYDAAMDAWAEAQKITRAGATDGSVFGVAAALDGDLLAVSGADGALDSSPGVVWIYARDAATGEFVEVTRVSGELDVLEGDLFGASVAIDGEHLIVGAPGAVDGAGAAHVFRRNSGGEDAWGREVSLASPASEVGDAFGASVAIEGTVVFVGAPGQDGSAGAGYLFERDRGGAGLWGNSAQVHAADAEAGDRLGASVALTPSYAVAASGDFHGVVSGSGQVLMFSRADETLALGEVTRLMASSPEADERFADAFVANDEWVLVGAPLRSGGEGAVEAFSVAPTSGPIAADDTGTTSEDSSVTIDVLANDTEPDGDVLSVSIVTQPGRGTASVGRDQRVTYRPANDYSGSDSFVYRVFDADGGSQATVSITVDPTPDRPRWVAPTPKAAVVYDLSRVSDGQLTFAVGVHDPDPGDVVTITGQNLPSGSSVDPSTGTFTWDGLSESDLGTYMFEMIASDGELEATQAFTVVIATTTSPNACSDVVCGAGEVCAGGSCVRSAGCSNDAECGEDFVCASNICLYNPPAQDPGVDDDCSCAVTTASNRRAPWPLAGLLMFGVVALRRRRRDRADA